SGGQTAVRTREPDIERRDEAVEAAGTRDDVAPRDDERPPSSERELPLRRRERLAEDAQADDLRPVEVGGGPAAARTAAHRAGCDLAAEDRHAADTRRRGRRR